MTSESRRKFLAASARLAPAAFACSWLARAAAANPLGRPIGIQLYTVRDALQADAPATLGKLRAIGYAQVETAGFGALSAGQFRRVLDDAGLACPSAHLSFDPANLGPAFEDAHALGARYVVSGSLPPPPPDRGPAHGAAHDAKRTAELANRIGEAARRAGLQYAYHNHDAEFVTAADGSVPYDVLLRETDPQLVKFEIDCGWMIFAGRDPIAYFKKYPDRFPMIHVKDFLPVTGSRPGEVSGAGARSDAGAGKPTMAGAELGTGAVDYKPIFAAAAKAGLQHYFVEQEGPFSRVPPLEAARIDYDYLHSLE